jgi:large subunit ribosomal protein L30
MPAKKSDSVEGEAKPRKPRAEKKSKVVKEAGVEEKELPKEVHEARPKEKLFAVIRVRGSVGITREMKDTLMMLRLHRINHCVIVPKNQNYEGMLHKARNFITWGEIDQETLEKLVSKRGRFAGDKKVTDLSYAKELAQLIISGKKVKDVGIKPVFRLSPPSKGYKSTKALYPRGSLGYRGEKINELIKRMI